MKTKFDKLEIEQRSGSKEFYHVTGQFRIDWQQTQWYPEQVLKAVCRLLPEYIYYKPTHIIYSIVINIRNFQELEEYCTSLQRTFMEKVGEVNEVFKIQNALTTNN